MAWQGATGYYLRVNKAKKPEDERAVAIDDLRSEHTNPLESKFPKKI